MWLLSCLCFLQIIVCIYPRIPICLFVEKILQFIYSIADFKLLLFPVLGFHIFKDKNVFFFCFLQVVCFSVVVLDQVSIILFFLFNVISFMNDFKLLISQFAIMFTVKEV